MIDIIKREQTMAFEKIFDICQDRIHAIFLFLTVLELAQQQYLKVLSGEGINNFIIEYNENEEEHQVLDMTTPQD
jgi:segregation and condensation protein A